MKPIDVIRRLTVIGMLIAGLAGASAFAQDSDENSGSITISGYACPRGMTAEELDPAQCEPTEIPGMRLMYDYPASTTLGFAGLQTKTWSDLPLLPDEPTVFMMILGLNKFGYTYMYTGEHLTEPIQGLARVALTQEDPTANVQIYFLLAQDPIVSLNVSPLMCPSVDTDISECESPGGVQIAVEIDGQELDGSPLATWYSPDIDLAVIQFRAPFFSTVTLTEIGGLAEGYAPADGYDPLVIAASSFALGPGGGGESENYYAYIINVPQEQTGGDLYTLPILVVNCTAIPDTPIFLAESEECDPAPGVWFEATALDGTWLGACVSDAPGESISAGCTIDVPYDTTIVVTEDEETISAGYAPRDNPLLIDTPPGPPDGEWAFPAFVNLPELAVEPTTGAVVEPTETPIPANARPAHIHEGTCDALISDGSLDLDYLIPVEDIPEGPASAVPAETSFSVIEFPLDDLLATPHAINVHASLENMRAYLVCGEIGGVRDADGGIAIGLRETRGSGYEGIAYLVPDPDDPTLTDVWVFIAPQLAEEEQATPNGGTPGATPISG